MKRYFAFVLAVLGLAACSSRQSAEEASNSPKVLVLYYSQTDATKAVAEQIQARLGADIERIEAVEPYDGDFMQTVERCKQEMESGNSPAIKPLMSNLDEYDIIFLGYPVWCGTCAQPVATLLKENDFKGKKVVTFCTYGSGGLQSSTTDVQSALPLAEVVEGYGVRNARLASVSEELDRFLVEAGFKEGEVVALPAFMEHHPVTAGEKALFDQACGDYQFPLGTPVDVAVRESEGRTDYEFSAKSQNPQGEESVVTIYVTVSKAEGAKPEFTQVIR